MKSRTCQKYQQSQYGKFSGNNSCILFCAAVWLLFFQAFNSFALNSPYEKGDRSAVSNVIGSIPLYFEKNLGQTDESVDFLNRGPGYTLFLKGTKAVFRLQNMGNNIDEAGDAVFDGEGIKLGDVLTMSVVGGNPESIPQHVDMLDTRVNYFTGNDRTQWQTDIPVYKKVRYPQVYPGIDLEYYGRQGTLEYDFVVSKGADPNLIRLEYSGVDQVEIDQNGDLLLHKTGGIVRQKAPYTYQEIDGIRQEIPSRFVFYDENGRENNSSVSEVGFELASYDTSKPLVIDPALSYSSYLGGTSKDSAYGISTDSIGNIYVMGSTLSTNFPAATPYQPANAGSSDLFISKISADGSTLLYSTYLGGSNNEYPADLAVDSSGAAYVIGDTRSSDFPVSTGAIQETFGGGSYDVFVAKISAEGNTLEYSTFLGGTNSDYGDGIAVNGSGEAFVTGQAGSTEFPTYNALYPDIQGYTDAFVAQVNATGTALIYSTYIGGTSSDQAYDIVVDGSDNAYITGDTSSGSSFPFTAGAYDVTGSGSDVFVSKIGAGGSTLVYSTVFGGASTDYATGIAIDASGQVYITGRTFSSDFPAIGSYQTHGGGADAFLVQVNSVGSDLLYSTYIGGTQDDTAYAIAVDTLGTAFITGSTRSADFPVKQPFMQGSTHGGGDYDLFVSRFDVSQTGTDSLRYSVFLGGLAIDYGYALTSPAPGICYVVGSTRSLNFPLVNPLQGSSTVSSYYDDAFIAKISDDQLYADLAVIIEDVPDPVEVGHDYSYEVHVTNLGSETAHDVQLTHTLPAEITFISTNATQGTPVHNSGVVTLDIGTINYSETVTLSISVTAPVADTTLSSTAQVTATSPDPNLINNSIIEETLVRSEYRYFEMAVYSNDYPCGTVISSPAGIDCGSSSSICNADFLVDTPLTLTAVYNPDTCRFASWRDAYLGYQYGDELTITNSPWVRATFYHIDADLALSIENVNDFSLVSDTVEYHLTIENVGSNNAENLVLVDTLPADAVYVSSSISYGSCNYDSTAHQVTCNIPSLWTGHQMDLTIVVTASAIPGTMTNQVSVSNSVNEIDLTNNSVTAITTVTDQSHPLTVSLTGDGIGVVSSDSSGIDCGGDCSEIYAEGKTVTLSVAPERGSFFTGWTGGGCSATGNCVIVLDADKTVTANFTASPPPVIALPKTGQTSCFDDSGTVIDCAGTFQDGEIQAGIPWPEPRFELTYCNSAGPCSDQSADCDDDSATDMILDHLTGLTWTRSFNLSGGYPTYQEAFDTVSNINNTTGLGGHSDWRMPNANELSSIVLHQKEGSYTSTWLVSQGFVGPYNGTIWGATTVAGEYNGVLVLNGYLTSGTVEYGYKSQNYGVWAVRGVSSGPVLVRKTGQVLCFDIDGEIINCTGTGQDGEIQAGADWLEPNPRFSVIYCDSSGECLDQSTDCDSDESTDMVRDNLTGLLLARDANLTGSYGNMQVSRDAVSTVNSGSGLGGHTDWRIPNINELMSLVDYSNKSSYLQEGHPFVNVQYKYWSSTSVNRSLMTGDRAYYLDFQTGSANEQDKVYDGAYTWLIREDTGTADLQVTLADNPDPVRINGSFIYTIEILNNGPGVATDVSLVNNLPPEASFVSVASSQGSCSHSAGDVSCTMDDIARNSVSTVSIEVSVGSELITMENSVTVSTSKNEFNMADNSAEESTRISDTDFTLTVARGGTGSGTITSTPAGIDCGSSCSELYFDSSPVVLTAVADGSSLFMGWDGCDQVEGSQCTVAVDTDRTATALFDTTTSSANYYVAPDGDDTNSGLGWSRPFATIEKALSVAQSGEEIWVRNGTYQVPVVYESSKRAYLYIDKKVALYGGFSGTETSLEQRNYLSRNTIVDAGRSGYDSHGFLIHTSSDSGPGERARIDGFVIRDGWSRDSINAAFATGGGIFVNSGNPVIANSEIAFNYAYTGGGIGLSSAATIINCNIHHNDGSTRGGGIAGNSNVQIINSVISHNSTLGDGGGVAFWGGGGTILNSTIAENTSSNGGAGFDAYNEGLTIIKNSIIWGNERNGSPSEIEVNTTGSTSSVDVSYSIVRGGYSGTANIDTDPVFVNTSASVTDLDLRIQPSSDGINAGSNTALPNDTYDIDDNGDTTEQLSIDIAGNSRTEDIVDIGAYEFIPGLYPVHHLTLNVDQAGTGTLTGGGFTCTSSCSGDFFGGSFVLTATPDSSYHFAGWLGCSIMDWNECRVDFDSDLTITARFVHEDADADSDGMKDWWEWYYFDTMGQTAGGDYDGDDISNLDEFTNGTDPAHKCADVDDNNRVDSADLVLMLQILSGMDVVPDLRADCNGDQVIDIQEVMRGLDSITN